VLYRYYCKCVDANEAFHQHRPITPGHNSREYFRLIIAATSEAWAAEILRDSAPQELRNMSTVQRLFRRMLHDLGNAPFAYMRFIEISCFSEFSRVVPIPVFSALYGPSGAAFLVESAISDIVRYAVLQRILSGRGSLILITGLTVMRSLLFSLWI